jgi:hypothetical protein
MVPLSRICRYFGTLIFEGYGAAVKDMQIFWHARLGHVEFETYRRAPHFGAATGIDLTTHKIFFNCHTCLLQEASCRPIKGSLVKRASVIGDVIHTDLAGPMPPTISGHLKYIYLSKKKSDAGGVLRDLIVNFERELDCLVKSVHTDNAAEITGGDFNSCLREQGIKFTSTAPYSSEPKGLAEIFSKVLFACVRCLLDYSGMCDRSIAPRQPPTAHAMVCRSRALSPKNLVFGTFLRAVFSASAMGFCVICSMRVSHELGSFSSQLQLEYSPAV